MENKDDGNSLQKIMTKTKPNFYKQFWYINFY